MDKSPPVGVIFEALDRRLPSLDDFERRLGLALYRELLSGAPVSDGHLARAVGAEPDRVTRSLNGPGLSGLVYRDDGGEIVGFAGLAVVPMKHRFETAGRTLYTWCAWDALFLADALNLRARIESTCPETDSPIRLEVSRRGVEHRSPAETVMSFLLPGSDLFRQTTEESIGSFCHYVHFLASPETGAAWSARHEGTFTLSLEDGFRLGRMNNQVRFGRLPADC